MAERVAAVLRRSLDHLAAEVPASHRLLADELGSLVVQFEVDGEVFAVRGDERIEVVDGGAPDPGPRVVTSRSAILDVLDAELTLGDAVEAGRVQVRGALDDVLRAHDALIAYAHAAVRAPSSPRLLAALREPTGGRR
jgi:hypothetical protein